MLGYCLKNENVNEFCKMNFIQSLCHSLNLKKLKTKEEYGEVLSGTFERCECCNYLFINGHCSFKNRSNYI